LGGDKTLPKVKGGSVWERFGWKFLKWLICG